MSSERWKSVVHDPLRYPDDNPLRTDVHSLLSPLFEV